MEIVNSREWQFYLAYSIGSVLCGIMVLFLIGVGIWRPALVNRISLRLIFAISIYDFIVCMLQATSISQGPSAKCRARSFFSMFFGYASVYTASSIAVNLHMTLLRSRRKYLPSYVEYLYFIVPLIVSLLHWAPPIIWAATRGYCSAFEPIEPGTPGFILYVVFVQLLLPLIALSFNIVTSMRVIFMLLSEQQKVNQTLREIMYESTSQYTQSDDEKPHISIGVDDEQIGLRSQKTRKELKNNLLVMRRFNSAVIRIALYPLAPIAWWIINAAFYGLQYPLTMTKKEDTMGWVHMVSLAWFSMPAIAIANFLVFVTDPAFIKVVREVRKTVLARIQSSQPIASVSSDDESYGFRSSRSTSLLPNDFSTLVTKNGAAGKPKVTESMHTDTMSLGSVLDLTYTPPKFELARQASAPQAHTSATLRAYHDMVRRHPTVGTNEDANRMYSQM
ncbi:hypothetical protein IW136_000447 [Coemansia sp. RSA 678]|nr:hypothetical protein IW136_000447 [Coemansia sp. RSA 678]